MKIFSLEFWSYAGERAIKTVAQSAIAVLGTGSIGLFAIDWVSLANDEFRSKRTFLDRSRKGADFSWIVLISATEANIADGDEFDFSIGGAFFRFLQGFVGLQLVAVIEEEKYTDKNGAEQVTLRVKRMKKVPVDVDDI